MTNEEFFKYYAEYKNDLLTLASIVKYLKYAQIKPEIDEKRPPNFVYKVFYLTDPKTGVVFRIRQRFENAFTFEHIPLLVDYKRPSSAARRVLNEELYENNVLVASSCY